jgi:osmotically-inducible protein OsmY
VKLKTSYVLIAVVILLLQGCVSTLTKGEDRRSEGAYVEDSTIESTATSRIKKKYLDKIQFNVTSYNRKVLVTGEVLEEAIKADVTRIVGGVQNVTDIRNELVVAQLASFSSRSNDTLITSNVNLRLRDGGKEFRSDRVKIVTENGVVYLLGLVTHAEAKIATDIASTSRGVRKVVPYFEFID